MASINTSYNRTLHGLVRIADSRTGKTCDYPLYSPSDVASSIDISTGDPVVENGAYDLLVLLPPELTPAQVSVIINGSDPATTHVLPNSTSKVTPANQNNIQIPIELDRQPFLLTYGFVRIEVSLIDENPSKDEIVLTTKDIPCFSSDDNQASIIEGMLNNLLDAEEETVTGWMFTGVSDELSNYSIIDAAMRENSPKSLSSIIQFFESCVNEYESNYDYFRSHGFSKISRTNTRLPAAKIQRTGSHELLWIAKNSHVLFETPYETSIDYLGKYYLPREVETSMRNKTYDSYENRIVLGFIDELVLNASTILLSLRKQTLSIAAIEEKLSPFKSEEYSLPALILVRQCAIREKQFVTRLQNIINNLQKLKRKYSIALPGVNAQFTRNPRRTKVFQEVKVTRTFIH